MDEEHNYFSSRWDGDTEMPQGFPLLGSPPLSLGAMNLNVQLERERVAEGNHPLSLERVSDDNNSLALSDGAIPVTSPGLTTHHPLQFLEASPLTLSHKHHWWSLGMMLK